jgi:DNA ligase (NAD+)
MDIEGLGYQTIVTLLEKDWLRDVSDIYFLKPEQLAELEGWGDKSIGNLMKAIDESRTRPLEAFLRALGIPHVGGAASEVLAEEVGSLEKLESLTAAELEAIEGIGPIIAEAIEAYFAEERNLAVLARLREGGVEPAPPAPRKTGPFDGMSFVLTGSLEDFTRSQAQNEIEERGGKVTSSVSKKTDYVVVGENPGTKYDKALTLGVETIDEAGLKKLLG